ncbi:hypothetical protein SUGI_1165930 [Cryptomeria japonica]|nr:hypothetical protein SUGI_1165930 [Cryptomeria japonica]
MFGRRRCVDSLPPSPHVTSSTPFLPYLLLLLHKAPFLLSSVKLEGQEGGQEELNLSSLQPQIQIRPAKKGRGGMG